MTVVAVDTDEEDLSVTVTADFRAPVERVWQLWIDQRRLEKWWGPPTLPATFLSHHLVPGGEVRYFMTSPDGETYNGMWRVADIDPPTSLQFDDVFTNADGVPLADVPATRVSIRLVERDGGTRMVMRSQFESREPLERWLRTGTREGLEQAVAQMDELLRR